MQLIQCLAYHVLAESGTLAEHVRELTGVSIGDSALSQRRAKMPVMIFEQLMAASLKPKGDPKLHPGAFHQGLRLCGLDGSTFSVANTPQVKKKMRKARSRRRKAAFPKVGVAVMVELGLRNPLAAAVGAGGESEMELARKVLAQQPDESLLVMDRYYGVGKCLAELPQDGGRHFLGRVKTGLQRRVLASYADGSALVEIRSGKSKRLVREIEGLVAARGGQGRARTVRLWTSLLDWAAHPAMRMLALYARRWEQETFYKELKVDTRSTPLLKSQTPLTAMQEVASMILAYAVLLDCRVQAAKAGEVGVLRISFLKMLHAVQGLWRYLELSSDLLTPEGVAVLVQRTLEQLAHRVTPKRRRRSCQRALRQPVSSWPRLRRNTCKKGAINYSVNNVIK